MDPIAFFPIDVRGRSPLSSFVCFWFPFGQPRRWLPCVVLPHTPPASLGGPDWPFQGETRPGRSVSLFPFCHVISSPDPSRERSVSDVLLEYYHRVSVLMCFGRLHGSCVPACLVAPLRACWTYPTYLQAFHRSIHYSHQAVCPCMCTCGERLW